MKARLTAGFHPFERTLRRGTGVKGGQASAGAFSAGASAGASPGGREVEGSSIGKSFFFRESGFDQLQQKGACRKMFSFCSGRSSPVGPTSAPAGGAFPHPQPLPAGEGGGPAASLES